MRVNGWAFAADGQTTSAGYRSRYNEIKHLKARLQFRMTPAYAHTKFRGVLPDDECKALSDLDLLIIADMGNLCFGGACTRTGDTFSGSYNTD